MNSRNDIAKNWVSKSIKIGLFISFRPNASTYRVLQVERSYFSRIGGSTLRLFYMAMNSILKYIIRIASWFRTHSTVHFLLGSSQLSCLTCLHTKQLSFSLNDFSWWTNGRGICSDKNVWGDRRDLIFWLSPRMSGCPPSLDCDLFPKILAQQWNHMKSTGDTQEIPRVCDEASAQLNRGGSNWKDLWFSNVRDQLELEKVLRHTPQQIIHGHRNITNMT